MTTLRAAAQQALEALHSVEWHGGSSAWMLDDCKVDDAIKVLRAALVEDAMQKFTDVNQEVEAALGCEHCNSPLYAAVKCRVCGRETPIIEPEIKGDNKPVAWLHVPHSGNGMSLMVSLSQQREPSLYGASVPLFLKE